MKRLILTLAAIAAVAAPLAVATDASAQPRRGGHERHYDNRHYDNHGYRGGYRGAPARGYYAQPRYYGHATRPYYGAGYAWRRGGYLPPAYSGYYISDYGRYGLRPPPRGYRWHQVGNDYLLAAVATGLIFDIVTR